MNTKIFKLLTGISALAVAGLLSLIPAKASFAAASIQTNSYPERTYTTNLVNIIEWRIEESNIYTDVNGSINWAYSVNPSVTIEPCLNNPYFEFSINADGSQTVFASIIFSARISTSDSGNVSFNFIYDSIEYAGSVNMFCYDPGLGATGSVDAFETGDFRTVIPTTPTESTTPADPAASTQPSAPVDSTDPTVPTVPSGTPLSDEEVAAIAFSQAIAETVNEIEHASEGQVITCKGSGALSYRILAALAKTKGVTHIYTFEYKGIIFQSTITSELAAQAFSPDIEWYGPCFLAEHFPTIIIGVRL